jgi:hypothetical protein
MTIYRLWISALCLFLLGAQAVGAHGEGGYELSAQVEGYTLDLDYDYPTIVAKGEVGRLTFDLFTDESRKERVPFTDVWVRINQTHKDGKNGTTTFAGPVQKPEFGKTGFMYAFFEPGKYTVSVRYNNESQKVASHDFSIDVLPKELPEKPLINLDMLLGGAIGGISVGACLCVLWYLRKRKTLVE